jgi:hypothetical protein
MFSLFKSVSELAIDTFTVVVTPVEMVVDLADVVIKPLAEVTSDLAKDIKSLKD